MRRILLVAGIVLTAVACGGGSDDDGTNCGPNGECPTGLSCNKSTGKCILTGTQPDAAPTGPPETALVNGPPARTKETAISVSFIGTPTGVTFDCALDSAAAAACTSPYMTTVASGAHKIVVTAILGAQRDSTPLEVSFTVDTTAPTAKIDSGPTGTSGPSAAFTYSSNESGSTFQCALNGSFASCPASGVTYDSLTHGTSYTFEVKATDDVGNVGAPVSRVFTADAVGPTVNISSPGSGTTTGSSFQAVFAPATSEPVTCECDTGSGFAACTSGDTISLPDGPGMLSVRCRDAAGNLGQTAMASFTVSSVQPSVQITYPVANGFAPGTFTVTYDAFSAESYTCTLDTQSVACDKDGADLGPLTDGKHTFKVTVKSSLALEASDSVTFTSDGKPPVVTALLMGAVAGSGVATFTMTTSETLAMTSATIDGMPCTVDETFTLVTCSYLSPGNHVFELIGIDAAGNESVAATANTTMSYGPSKGHVVVMGHGFRVLNDDTTTALGNAAALAPVTELVGFARPLHVSFYDQGMADATEKANVRAALTTGLAGHGYTYDETAADWGTATEISDRLRGTDVLVVYNQGNATLTTTAAAWKVPLTAYLDAGGVVIVTDGWYGASKTPSRSYRVLDSTILSMGNSTLGGTDVMVNPFMLDGSLDEDPVAAGVASSFDLAIGDPAIILAPSERTLNKVLLACASMPCTKVSTVHKVFPTPTRGPLELTVLDDLGEPIDALIAVQDANGVVVGATTNTDADGYATRTVSEGDTVTVAFPLSGGGDGPNKILETMFAVEPYDVLHFGTNTTDREVAVTPLGPVKVTMEDKVLWRDESQMSAARYRAEVVCPYHGYDDRVNGPQECGQGWQETCTTPNDQGYFEIEYHSACLIDGDLAIAVSAMDSNDNVLGFQLLTGVNPSTGVTADSWDPPPSPDFTLVLKNPRSLLDQAKASMAYRIGDAYGTSGSAEFPAPIEGNPAVAMFAPDNADAVMLLVLQGGEGYGTLLLQGNMPTTTTTKTVDLSTLLEQATFSVTGTGGSRPVVAYEPALASASGAASIVFYPVAGGTAAWGFIYPPSMTSVKGPVLPSAMSAYAPNGSIELAGGVVVDDSRLNTYDEWRNEYFFPVVLPLKERAQYTLKVTGWGEAAQIFVPIGD